jgi:predicted ATP-grasp superfamily ATP-dependent carboligase
MTSNRQHALPVVVLGGGVTALGVLRAFGRRGIPVFVYPAPDALVQHSRWNRPLPRAHTVPVDAGVSVTALQRILVGCGIQRAFLCPCSDNWCRAVAGLAATQPESAYLSVVPPAAALEVLLDKGRLALLLEECDVPHPVTVPIGLGTDVALLPLSSETFYFLKPVDSQAFHARFGVKGLRATSVEGVRRRLDEILAAGLAVVLQEYVPGPAHHHYFLDGYADRRGSIRALFARRRLRIYPPDFGNSTAMLSIALEDVRPAIDSLRRTLEAVNYRGIFSAEFKRDARDGKFRLLEINTRPWWFVDFAQRCGVDVCGMAYADAQGRDPGPPPSGVVGATCVYPYYDYFAARPLVEAGELGWMTWLRQVAHARQPVACWDDPMPGALGLVRTLSSWLGHRLVRGAR